MSADTVLIYGNADVTASEFMMGIQQKEIHRVSCREHSVRRTCAVGFNISIHFILFPLAAGSPKTPWDYPVT